jgi:hypothetical protein
MSKNAAGEEIMGELHAKVAAVLLAQLEGRNYIDPETGEEVKMDPDPRIVSAAITFLNNNKVSMNPFVANTLSKIEKELEERAATRFSVIRGQAQEEARKAAGLG